MTLMGPLLLFRDMAQHYAGFDSWQDATYERYKKALTENFLSRVKDYNKRPASDYKREEIDKIMKQIKQECDQGTLPSSAAADVDKALRASFYVLFQLGEIPENIYKDESSDEKIKTKIVRRTVKSLSEAKSVEAIKLITEYMDKQTAIVDKHGNKLDPACFAALFLMNVCGLRDNASVGVLNGHIKEMKDHPKVFYLTAVQSESSYSHKTQDGGKTSNMQRCIPFGDSAIKPILRHIRKNKDLLFGIDPTGTQKIDDLPFAMKLKESWRDDSGKRVKEKTFVPCSAAEVTLAGNFILDQIGVRSEERCLLSHIINEEMESLTENYENVDNTIVRNNNATSYLFRHEFSTNLAKVGMDPIYIFYLMGHQIQNDPRYKRSLLSNEQELYRMYEKINKYPLYNVSVLYDNDEMPVKITETEQTIKGSYKYVIEAELKPGDMLKQEIEPNLPGQGISISTEFLIDKGNVEVTYKETEPPLNRDDSKLQEPDFMDWVRKKFLKTDIKNIYAKWR